MFLGKCFIWNNYFPKTSHEYFHIKDNTACPLVKVICLTIFLWPVCYQTWLKALLSMLNLKPRKEFSTKPINRSATKLTSDVLFVKLHIRRSFIKKRYRWPLNNSGVRGGGLPCSRKSMCNLCSATHHSVWASRAALQYLLWKKKSTCKWTRILQTRAVQGSTVIIHIKQEIMVLKPKLKYLT